MITVTGKTQKKSKETQQWATHFIRTYIDAMAAYRMQQLTANLIEMQQKMAHHRNLKTIISSKKIHISGIV